MLLKSSGPQPFEGQTRHDHGVEHYVVRWLALMASMLYRNGSEGRFYMPLLLVYRVLACMRQPTAQIATTPVPPYVHRTPILSGCMPDHTVQNRYPLHLSQAIT